MSKDPDRYDPERDGPVEHVEIAPVQRQPGPRLDRSRDPDRYDPERDGRPGPGRRSDPTTQDLLGESVGDDARDNWTWAVGLLGVLAFLGLVALLFGRVLSPG